MAWKLVNVKKSPRRIWRRRLRRSTFLPPCQEDRRGIVALPLRPPVDGGSGSPAVLVLEHCDAVGCLSRAGGGVALGDSAFFPYFGWSRAVDNAVVVYVFRSAVDQEARSGESGWNQGTTHANFVVSKRRGIVPLMRGQIMIFRISKAPTAFQGRSLRE